MTTFQLSNQFASKAIIHPEYEPEASVFESPHGTYFESPHGTYITNPLDQMGFTNPSNDVVTNDLQTSWRGSWDKFSIRAHPGGMGLRAHPGGDGFMRLGDIKGEFAPSHRCDDDAAAGLTAARHEKAAGDPLPTEEIISNHGNRTNWDAICDVGTSIKQTSVADALTNYRPEGFSKVEIDFVQSVDNDHDPAVQFNQGDPFSELDQGVFAPVNVLRSDNRFAEVPVDLFQGLDAGGMNYAEAVGLDSWQGSFDKMPGLLNPNECLN